MTKKLQLKRLILRKILMKSNFTKQNNFFGTKKFLIQKVCKIRLQKIILQAFFRKSLELN
jgi:hypothetical protein